MKTRWLSLLCLVLVFVSPCTALSHPHVWADYAVTAVFNDKGLEGFRLQWTFDEMFSEQIVEYGDLKSSTPTADQIRRIKEGLFDNLRHYNYFSRIWIDGQEFKVQFVRDFTVRIHGGRAVYEFFVPCTVLAIQTPKSVRFMSMDPEIFVDLTWERQDPVKTVHPAGIRAEHEMHEDRSSGLFGDLFAPRVLHLQFWKEA